MRVLVVGGGGREHALAWKISQSPLVDRTYCAPGNAGIAEVAECVDIKADDVEGLLHFGRDNDIGLTVVGPEDPLTLGLVDVFRKEGLKAFGPSRDAAEIEGSKVFAKEVMHRHVIPTAQFRVFDKADEALAYLDVTPAPIVVKADGLAKGKGVIVCRTDEEARDAVRRIMVDGEFGDAGDRAVIEECLKGEEASIIALTDGKTIVPLLSSQDHKPVHDHDKGPNTGGMGAYAPVPLITPGVFKEIERKVLVQVVHAMHREKRRYRGVVYAGLMITPGGPMVLEFNCRFGDPETQPVFMMLKSDIVPALLATIEGKLGAVALEWETGAAVCVVMASGGYPGPYEKGKPIQGLDRLKGEKDVQVFHAGTAIKDGQVVTNGGRVLGVTARGPDLRTAQQRAYEAVGQISFEGAHYRGDIGNKGLA